MQKSNLGICRKLIVSGAQYVHLLIIVSGKIAVDLCTQFTNDWISSTMTYSQIIPAFQTSRLVCTLGLSLFVAGLGVGPMVLGPLSEVRNQMSF